MQILDRSHICLFYSTHKDLLDLVIPYFKEGLRKNEKCVWVLSDSLRVEDAKTALAEALPDLEKHLESSQLELFDYKNWYFKSGQFDKKEVMSRWADKEKQALNEGFDHLRVSGEGSWFREGRWEDLIEYEKDCDQEIPNRKITALCTYPITHLDVSEMYILSKVHRYAFSNKEGQWHLIKNVHLDNLLFNIKHFLNGDKNN